MKTVDKLKKKAVERNVHLPNLNIAVVKIITFTEIQGVKNN